MSGQQPSQHKRLVAKLALVTLGMFGFGFAMVPLYRVFCEITGQGVWIATGPKESTTSAVDRSRLVTVEFVGSVNNNGPWSFRPTVDKMLVHPGELYTTTYRAENLRHSEATAQAVYSVVPVEATRHFGKPDCFCFTQQPFQPREAKDLKVTFYIDPALPKNVETVTLAYTFFDVTGQQAN